MERPRWKTIIIYGVLPVLLLAVLLAMAVAGQVRGHGSGQPQPSPTAVTSAPALRAPADVCRTEAVAMLARWKDGTLASSDMAAGAVIASHDGSLPATDGAWSAGLLASGDGTVTCSVLAGGDQPYTVGLRLEGGHWKAALIRMPGSDRP